MRIHQLVAGLVVAGALWIGSPAQAEVCGTPHVTTLFAGQTIPAGTVNVYNDESFIYVQYAMNSPWVLSEAHVGIAGALEGIPQTKKGNPIPGRFPYSATFDPELGTYTFVIPMGSFTPDQQVVIAAHAVVTAPRELGGTQTGWGFGPEFPGANWATYIGYTVQSCGGGSPE